MFCRLRYRLTLRELSEILLLRGIVVSHEAIRDWETKLLPVMGHELSKRRHGTRRGAGASWYIDETYLKVRGKWVYLCRAIERDGNLIDAMLSECRDMTAAKAHGSARGGVCSVLALRHFLRANSFYRLIWHGPLSLTILIAGGMVVFAGYWHPLP
jgi:hypothetical protein